MIVENQIRRLGYLGRCVDADQTRRAAAARFGIEALYVATLELGQGNAQIDFGVVRNILSVPPLHVVKERNRRADDIHSLPGQQLAHPGVAHRRAPPLVFAIAEIVGHDAAQLVAVKEHHAAIGRAKSCRQLLADGRLAGSGKPRYPKNAPWAFVKRHRQNILHNGVPCAPNFIFVSHYHRAAGSTNKIIAL